MVQERGPPTGNMRGNCRSSTMRSPTGVLITFCVGVAATLGWQSYGDAAREIIASSYPQLGWFAPKPAPNTPNAPDLSTLALPHTPSPDHPHLNSIYLP